MENEKSSQPPSGAEFPMPECKPPRGSDAPGPAMRIAICPECSSCKWDWADGPPPHDGYWWCKVMTRPAINRTDTATELCQVDARSCFYMGNDEFDGRDVIVSHWPVEVKEPPL